MTVKIKDIRHKHQVRAKEIPEIQDKQARELAWEEFAVSLVTEWDYTGEDGAVLPISAASFPELKIEDIDELSESINAVLFPPKVKKTSDSRSPSGLTPSKPAKAVKEKSPNGLTTSLLAVGQE